LTPAPKTRFKTPTANDTANRTAVNASSAPSVNDTYPLSSSTPGQLTLTRASNGATQTLTLASIAAGGSQTINFGTLGISLTVGSTNGISASDLATALSAPANNTIKTKPNTVTTTTTQNATISNVDVSAAPAAATTYTMTSSAVGQVTLTRASDGATQTLTLAAIAAGRSQTVNFNTLGVVYTVTSAAGITAQNLANALTAVANDDLVTKVNSTTTTTTQNATLTTLDVSGAPHQNDTYTLSSSTPGQVTLTRASDGANQTLTLADIAAGGSETINFGTLGISLTVGSTNGISASDLATALSAPANNTIKTKPNTVTTTTTQNATISTVDVSASPAVATTYTMTS